MLSATLVILVLAPGAQTSPYVKRRDLFPALPLLQRAEQLARLQDLPKLAVAADALSTNVESRQKLLEADD